ncbi:MAG TPA: hypothetical protein VJ765_09410 [Chitinophagaceae bacterium]|nr:hypothetical protein [Chitinophagaceae bacterium]
MKYIFTISLFGLVYSAFGQKTKPVTFDSLRQYSIAYEDSLMDIWGVGMNIHEYETVNADLRIPNNWGPTEINFGEADLRGDSLFIEFHGYPGHTVETFKIVVVMDKYWSYYNFRDDDDFVSKMTPIETKLILNNGNYKKGTAIKGYTEYIGKCRNCKENKIIEIKGSFKILIE